MQIKKQEYTPYLSRMMGFVCVMDNREEMDKVICKSTKHIKDKQQNGKPHNKKKFTKCVECGCSVLQKSVQCNGQGLQKHKTQGDVRNKQHNGKELQNTRPWKKDNVWETKKNTQKKPSKKKP